MNPRQPQFPRTPQLPAVGKSRLLPNRTTFLCAILALVAIVVFTLARNLIELRRETESRLATARALGAATRDERGIIDHLRDEALAQAERKNHEPPPPPRPRPPTPPDRPMFEPITSAPFEAWVFNHGDILAGSSRLTDVNDDGNEEYFITNIDPRSCAVRYCPVLLLQAKRLKPTDERATVRNLLPYNNNEWSTVAVVRHKTNGMRDIIVTGPNGCQRLTWRGSTQLYAMDEINPSPQECLEAEKTAWNIADDHARFERYRPSRTFAWFEP